MFSVKHIRLSGEEDLYHTPTVRYTPGGNHEGGHTTYPPEPATVWYRKPDGFEHPLTGGTVFVMNDTGKTVARYDIGASMVPFSEGDASGNGRYGSGEQTMAAGSGR